MSRDSRIDAYIARAEPFARPILEHVRERIHLAVPEAEETIKWGAPAFTLDGRILLLMAAFKAHAALNFWRGQELSGESANAEAMGQFGRLTSVADLPASHELDGLIRRAAELARSAPAPRKPKHSRRPEPAVHPTSPPHSSVRRRPGPRSTPFRPAPGATISNGLPRRSRTSHAGNGSRTAVEWLSEGKRRNWKYERC